jgi:hypothetical protein
MFSLILLLRHVAWTVTWRTRRAFFGPPIANGIGLVSNPQRIKRS